MSVITVIGEIKQNDLGVVSPHEHILIDLRKLVEKGDIPDSIFWSKLSLENRREVSCDPYRMLDNAFFDDVTCAERELRYFKKDGGDSIVDVTLDEIGRCPNKLKELSEKTGVKVVMGCGNYVGALHTNKTKSATVLERAEIMEKELTIGVGDTGIRAGVIGEIGTSATLSESEITSLRAAGLAAVKTNAGVHVHTSLWEENGLFVSDELIKLGVDPGKICINHVDVDLRKSYITELLKKGVLVEFDNFGKEFYISKRNYGNLKGRFAYDLERVMMLKELIQDGFERQILISNDICLKQMLVTYGGDGYGHILRVVHDMLRDVGISENTIDNIYRHNTANFLDR